MIKSTLLFDSAIKISKKLINEPCLVDGNWIELAVKKKLDQDKFAQGYSQAVQLAHQNKFNKIELVIPADLTKLTTVAIAAEAVAQYKFRPALSEFKFDFTLPTASKTVSNDYLLTPQAQPLEQMLPLLQEQAAFHHQLAPDYYLSVNQLRWPTYQKQIMIDQTKKNALCLHLLHQQQLIGTIIGEQQANTASIWEIVIKEGYRNQGLGSLLMAHYLNQLKSLEITQVLLETWPDTPAYGWYQKMGWTKTQQSWYKRLSGKKNKSKNLSVPQI